MENIKGIEKEEDKIDQKIKLVRELEELEKERLAGHSFLDSSFGKIVSFICFIVGIFSVFFYKNTLDVNIFFSIILGIVTYMILGLITTKFLS